MLSLCCLSIPAILWWIVHLRRWISTESTRTIWHLQAWPSSSASGMILSPAPFTTHSVSFFGFLAFHKRFWKGLNWGLWGHCLATNNKACLLYLPLQTWGSRCLTLSGLQCTTLHRSNSPRDSPCVTWTDTEMERSTPMEYIDCETHVHREEKTHFLANV